MAQTPAPSRGHHTTGGEASADDLTGLAVYIGRSDPEPAIHATEVEIRSQMDQLAGLRSCIKAFCAALAPAPSAEDVQAMQLAVHEAATNVVRHAYKMRPDGPIWLQLQAFDDRITLRLVHTGESFDPDLVDPPDFSGQREGGFGIYIISQLMAQASYEQDEQGRQVVRLVKTR